MWVKKNSRKNMINMDLEKKIYRLPDESMKECVARKIRMNMNEGMPHDQAIAAAFTMCKQVAKALEKEPDLIFDEDGNMLEKGVLGKAALSAGRWITYNGRRIFIRTKTPTTPKVPAKTALEEFRRSGNHFDDATLGRILQDIYPKGTKIKKK